MEDYSGALRSRVERTRENGFRQAGCKNKQSQRSASGCSGLRNCSHKGQLWASELCIAEAGICRCHRRVTWRNDQAQAPAGRNLAVDIGYDRRAWRKRKSIFGPVAHLREATGAKQKDGAKLTAKTGRSIRSAVDERRANRFNIC